MTTQPSELLKRLDTIMQGRVNATLRYKREDYAEMVKIVTLDLPSAIRAVVHAPQPLRDEADTKTVIDFIVRRSVDMKEAERVTVAVNRLMASALPAQAARHEAASQNPDETDWRKIAPELAPLYDDLCFRLSGSVVDEHMERIARTLLAMRSVAAPSKEREALMLDAEALASRLRQWAVTKPVPDGASADILKAASALVTMRAALIDADYQNQDLRDQRSVMTSAAPVSEEVRKTAKSHADRIRWLIDNQAGTLEFAREMLNDAKSIMTCLDALIKGGA